MTTKVSTFSLYQCSCGLTFEGSAIAEHYEHSFSLRTTFSYAEPIDGDDDEVDELDEAIAIMETMESAQDSDPRDGRD